MFIEKFRHLHFSTSFHIQLPDFECSASIFNAISPSNHIQYQHKHDGVRKSYKKVYSHLTSHIPKNRLRKVAITIEIETIVNLLVNEHDEIAC